MRISLNSRLSYAFPFLFDTDSVKTVEVIHGDGSDEPIYILWINTSSFLIAIRSAPYLWASSQYNLYKECCRRMNATDIHAYLTKNVGEWNYSLEDDWFVQELFVIIDERFPLVNDW